MSADILAKFYGLIFFSAIFIVAAVRVVISRRSQTSPAVLPVNSRSGRNVRPSWRPLGVLSYDTEIMSYKQPLAPTAPPAEAVVVTVEPRTTADELRMGATAMAPDQHERKFQTDVCDSFNHSDYLGTGLASFCCPCHMCGQLLEKQGHRGRHRCVTT